MSEPEIKTSESSELAELRAQCLDLHRQTSLLMVGLLVASFTLAAFLGVQSKRAGGELGQMKHMMAEAKKEEANIQGFIGRLVEYGRKDPGFLPTLGKYGIKPAPGPTSLPSGAAPAPATPRR